MTRSNYLRWGIGLIAVLILVCGAIVMHFGISPFPQIRSLASELRETSEKSFFQDISNRQRQLCPENALVVVIAGQSQAANTNSHISEPNLNIPAYNYYNGECYYIEDPILGGDDVGGSLWVEFAHTFYRDTGRPIIIALRAFNASSITQWTGVKPNYRMSLENELRLMSSDGIEPDVFVWFQGETDALYKIEKDAYKEGITEFYTYLSGQSLLPATTQWLLFETSICKHVAIKYLPLKHARLEFAALSENVHIGPDTDALGKVFRQADDCHFNQAAKKEIAAQLIEMTKGF